MTMSLRPPAEFSPPSPGSEEPLWRKMTAADLPAVETIGSTVHPDLPEDPAVFAERLNLYPDGCWVVQIDGAIAGYAVSHPWRLGPPPKLNSLLNRLPHAPDSFYIHDLALVPLARGTGAGSRLVHRLVEQARREHLHRMSLVAVNGSSSFWQRHGFHAADDAVITQSLGSYGDTACWMVREI